MIVVDNLSKSYGKQALFDAVSFKVNRRERVGVVGRNGHGKTTLFRMITGEDEPDEGTITKPRRYRIGYVEQRPRFTEPTVLAEAAKALAAAISANSNPSGRIRGPSGRPWASRWPSIRPSGPSGRRPGCAT